MKNKNDVRLLRSTFTSAIMRECNTIDAKIAMSELC